MHSTCVSNKAIRGVSHGVMSYREYSSNNNSVNNMDNRWRLFCLKISYIGWGLLPTLTGGIGYLFLRPYMNASFASFYREVSISWKNDNHYDELHIDKDYIKNYNIKNNITN